MPVIVKKDEKVAAVIAELSGDMTHESFSAKFKEMYPKDWARIQKVYRDHEREAKPGKSHPMPEPEQYLKNCFNNWPKAQ